MPPTSDFFPSQKHPLILGLVQSLSGLICRWKFNLRVQVSAADLATLRQLRRKRVVLMPNHTNFDDGVAMFRLGARVGDRFNFMVAHENFKGFLAKFLPAVGAYSIRRGLSDRASIAHTLELMRADQAHLVIFPEGGCSFQNDYVTPFRSGAIQLPLQAMGQLFKKNKTVEDFYLVPVGIKYRYDQPMDTVIDRTLATLENHFQIQPETQDFYPRLRTVAAAAMENIEQEYGRDRPEIKEQDWNHRIQALKNILIADCEEKLQISSPEHLPNREKVYRIQAILANLKDQEDNPQNQELYDFLYRATTRLLNFDSIYDGYVGSNPTPERYLDTLIRLEREAFRIDIPEPKARRVAQIQLGELVNLKDYFDDFKINKTQTVEQLTQKIQRSVQAQLDLMNQTKY